MTRPAARRRGTGQRGTGGAPDTGARRRGSGRPRPPAPPPSPLIRRRRRIAALVGAGLLLALVAVGVRVLVYDLGLFEVEGVEVTGTQTVAVDEVLAAAAVVPGGPLAAVDTAGIAARVAQLPGIAAVEVGRGWPHTVTVAVTERMPVAVVDTPGGRLPVDATGVVYAGLVPPDLPRLTFGTAGPEDPATLAALAVLADLPALHGQVLTVDVASGGGTEQVTLGLVDNRQVRWGSPERGEEKAEVLVALLTQPGRVYDVTSPELPTVRS